MQTFLPYPDFEQSAKCLDYRRLGKQRVEVMQLLKALATGPQQLYPKIRSTPWFNHPAAQMWRGYEQALTNYGFACIDEWESRGYKDTCHDKICDIVSIWSEDWDPRCAIVPPWLGDEQFHAAHRSNLLRKDPEWYGQFGWTEPNNLEYIWPSRDSGQNGARLVNAFPNLQQIPKSDTSPFKNLFIKDTK